MIDIARIALATAAALATTAAHAQSVRVELVETSPGAYQLMRDGSPYRVDGAGRNNYVDEIALAGGNSTRVWGIGSDTIGLLNEAHANGLTIAVGIWLAHGANYNDPNLRAQQLAQIEQQVRMVKDHPAVLVWGIGNETEGFADGDNPALWQHVETIAQMIKSIDPDHPTMTTIAEIGGARVQQIHQYCPSLDIVGINTYGGATSIPQRYRAAGGTKPYLITEYAQALTFESGQTGWGVPFELTSAAKAQVYHNVYDALHADTDLCLGSYAFVWGSGTDPTSTWYCTHLPDGSKLAVVDELTAAWGGPEPTNHAPLITSFSASGSARVEGGELITASIELFDEDADDLDVEYVLQNDFWSDVYNAPAATYPDAIVSTTENSVTFRVPSSAGPIRLYAYARDGRGAAATANIPFFAIEPEADYELVFEEQFTTLDTSVWQPMIGDGTDYGLPAGWGANELQTYTTSPANAYANNVLHILAREQSGQYTSARFRTIDALEMLYGRVEARIDLPNAQGLRPVFSMLPTNSPYGDNAAAGEIDVVESINQADAIFGGIRFGAPGATQSDIGSESELEDYASGYHTYAMEWTPSEMRWFVDGREYHAVAKEDWFTSAAPNDPWAPFDNPFHLVLSLAVGGDRAGPPEPSPFFIHEMIIDWIRIYEREQFPFNAEPATIPGRVEAEHYDVGGDGVSYRDRDNSNNGGALRPGDAVDIEGSSGGGNNIGWIEAGEWLEYTVDVQAAGPHEVRFRVASNESGGRFRLTSDSGDLTNPIDAPFTGGWQNWTEIPRVINLPAGEQTIRFQVESDSNGFNLDRMDFTALCPADWDLSGGIDAFDVIRFTSDFHEGGSAADVTGDGAVSEADFVAFLAAAHGACEN
ncbi:MAG: hypothetical protein CMJ31_05225 [Phycisphaerae bacterium]|nr:hypothetical protein [Phycisphaerae bacterium]